MSRSGQVDSMISLHGSSSHLAPSPLQHPFGELNVPRRSACDQATRAGLPQAKHHFRQKQQAVHRFQVRLGGDSYEQHTQLRFLDVQTQNSFA